MTNKTREWCRERLDEKINTVTHYEIPSMDIMDSSQKPCIKHLLYLLLYHYTSCLVIVKIKLQIV